jgi:ferrous-iron efflux pump FieF
VISSETHPNQHPATATHRLMRLATYASVSVAAVLIVVKLAAWLMTDSVSLLSSLIDSALDASASLLNAYAIHHSIQPADDEHRFGHGKAEPLAGMGQTLLIGASGMLLLFEAVPRLLAPQPVQEADIGVAVMLFSMVLTVALVGFQRYVVRRSGSVAIDADSLHYVSDLLMNAAIIMALLLSRYLDWHLADPVFAIAIAVYVLFTAARIARGSLDILMDRELPDEERERIEAICREHPLVRGVHELRTRRSGLTRFVQLHLDMDGDLPLREANRVAHEVAGQIHQAFPDSEVLIHQDPM